MDDARFDPAACDLSPAEQRVLDSLADGSVADVTDAGDAKVRAEFLRAVMSGRCGDWPVYRGALRIAGARVRGVLRAPMGEHAAASGRTTLVMRGCTFDAPVDLSGGEFMALHLIGCEGPAFIGANLEVRADLDLSGSRFTGVDGFQSEMTEVEPCAVCLNGSRIGGRLLMRARPEARFVANGTVRLEGARIGADLVLDGARLDGGGDQALNARTATIGGDVSGRPACGDVFHAMGETSFSAATITGDLLLDGAHLSNTAGRALHCEDLRVERLVLSAHQGQIPFRAHGRLNFLTAIVGGSFFLSNARLSPGPDYQGRAAKGGPVAVNLQQLRVSNGLFMTNVRALAPDAPTPEVDAPGDPLRGWMLLTGSHIHTLIDDESAWPEAGFLDLEGAAYDRIYDPEGHDPRRRLAWLRRQFPNETPTARTFRPQPYEELTRVLRALGRNEESDDVAVEKIRMRLAARVDDGWARLLPKILMAVSLHGYSSARAIVAFAIYIALGAAFYATALWGFGQPFVPIEGDPAPVTYALPFGLGAATHAEGCPAFALPWYAVDVALPLIDLGQSSICRFAPEGPARELWIALHSLYAILGAALSAVVVLTLSGVMRRD